MTKQKMRVLEDIAGDAISKMINSIFRYYSASAGEENLFKIP